MYVEVRPKHNSTMVSDASPGTADPKMNESFVHTAQMSYDRACAQGNFKNQENLNRILSFWSRWNRMRNETILYTLLSK
jgi:hypothetical protein